MFDLQNTVKKKKGFAKLNAKIIKHYTANLYKANSGIDVQVVF